MNKKKNQQLVAIGNKIRSQRIETGLSQEEFAVLAGLDRSYYGGVERGERNISVLNLIRIASSLNREVGDLFPSINKLNNL